MKEIKGDLVLKKDTRFDENIEVEGDIICEGGLWNLDCRNLDCWDLNCNNLNCNDLKCWNLTCWNLNCNDLDCRDLTCWDLNCRDLNFWAIAIAYNSFKCKSWKARRKNYIIKCLDGEMEIEEEKEE